MCPPTKKLSEKHNAQHYNKTSTQPLWLGVTITATTSFKLRDRQRNRLQKEIWNRQHRNQWINLKALGGCYEGTFVSQTAPAQHTHAPVSLLGTTRTLQTVLWECCIHYWQRQVQTEPHDVVGLTREPYISTGLSKKEKKRKKNHH